MAGPLSSSGLPPARPLEVLGLVGLGEGRRGGREDSAFKLRKVVGAYPQKCIISPRFCFLFLLKIYYKKTQLGEGHLSLSVLRAGEGDSRGPEAAPAARWGWAGVTAGRSRPPSPGCAAAAARGARHSRSSAPRSVASGAHCPSAAARPP
uniref:Upstream stimulatory factor 2 isoform X2 n=1 Tax=Sus scrofa TaxID=9823 RepID=A0A480H4W1_PIG